MRAGLTTAALVAAMTASVAARAATEGAPADELRCLAKTIYFEARGESARGQQAVAHVVMNRVADPRFPDSICGVVRQGGDQHLFGCQFTWWCDGRSDRPRNLSAWYSALLTAVDVLAGATPDSTRGALWYHATYVSPPWRGDMVLLAKIGKHLFYGELQRVASRD